jgi:lysophospholipid acyltransferase (LPLAT)-like uncharacterized protein
VGWRRVLAKMGGLFVRLWASSLRLTLSDSTRQLLEADPQPTLFILWHNRLFIAADLSRRLRQHRPLHCLVSTSKDGAWLSAFFEALHLKVVRGSSSKGGREAVGDLVQILRSGQDAGITPDGPRGPVYVCKPGALVIARRAGVRVVLLGVAYEAVWRLRSWDRFMLPRPFSTVHLSTQLFSPTELASESALKDLDASLRSLNSSE